VSRCFRIPMSFRVCLGDVQFRLHIRRARYAVLCTRLGFITPPATGQRSIVMSVTVCLCLCLCLSAFISSELHVRSSPNFLHVTYNRGSVLLWRRSDTLCTTGFTDDVIFAYKPKLLDVAAQLKRSAHAALGFAINCAQ